MTALLSLEGLSKSVMEGTQRRVILDGVDAEVQEGEIIALLGRSGAGKSTLLNVLAGIEPADAGRVLLEGQDLNRLSERERTLFRREHIGFVYQFFNLLPTLSVAENVALPLELNHKSEIQARVMEMLSLVGLADRAASFPDRLSGGEQQRVAIARALAHAPRLVLADEPTGNLDAETGAQVMSLLRDLVKKRGRTLILVTHSAEVAAIADRVWRLEQGQILVEAAT